MKKYALAMLAAVAFANTATVSAAPSAIPACPKGSTDCNCRFVCPPMVQGAAQSVGNPA